MKKIIPGILLLLALCVTSCNNDGSVSINSLNTFGSKVARNDRVKVFVSADMSDFEKAKYHWECSGGEFTNPNGLFENVWRAPNVPGTYELKVTVKCENKSDTRAAKIIVTDEYFFRDYGATYSNDGFTTSNMNVTAQASFPTTGYNNLQSTNDNSRYYRNWNDTNLYPPFSWQLKYWPFTVNSDARQVNFRLNFGRPSGATKYITRVEFQTFPRTGSWSLNYTYYDATLGGDNTMVQISSITPEPKLMIAGSGNNNLEWRHIAISIDANLNFTVHTEGSTLLVNDNFLQALAASEGFQYLITSSEINMSNTVVTRITDFTVFENGTILTAVQNDR